jgi:hypothetical protein
MEKDVLLDSSSCRARTEPFAYLLAKLLSDERHPMDREGSVGQRVVEEPRDDLDVGGVLDALFLARCREIWGDERFPPIFQRMHQGCQLPPTTRGEEGDEESDES